MSNGAGAAQPRMRQEFRPGGRRRDQSRAQRPAPDQALSARMQRLEDMEEIRTVLLNYGRYLDARDFGAYSRLFAKDGEWAQPRIVFTQFQNVAPNDVEQFADGNKQPILWPPQYKTGDLVYPYANARK